MKNYLMMAAIAVSIVVLGASCNCGPGGGGTVSCDQGSGESHTCFEWTVAGAIYTTAYWTQQCTAENGTAGSACSHAGAVGACSFNYSGTYTAVNWYYTGNVTTQQASCTQAGTVSGITTTWITP